MTLYAKYTEFCNKNIRQVLGRQGMLQHHFANENDANEFVFWLKQRPALENLAIEKAYVEKMQYEKADVYCVRLSSQQFEIIAGKNTFAKLLSEDELNTIYATLKQDKTHFTNLVNALKLPALALDINQRRLLVKSSATRATYSNIFTYCFSEISNSERLTILNLVNKNILPQLMLMHVPAGWSLLHSVAGTDDDTIFQTFISSIDSCYLQQCVKLIDIYNHSVLYWAVVQQSNIMLKLFFKQLTPTIIAELLGKKGLNGYTPLHRMSGNDKLASILEIAPSAVLTNAISETLLIKDDDGFTPLHYAAKHSSTPEFISLVRTVTKDSLHKACRILKAGKSILELSPFAESCIGLLSAVDEKTLDFLFNHKRNAAQIVHLLNLIEDKTLIAKLFPYFSYEITHFFREQWINGINTPDSARDSIIAYLNVGDLLLTAKDHSYKASLLTATQPALSINTRLAVTIALADIDQEDNVETLWQQGLKSWQDHHVLKKYLNTLLKDSSSINGNLLHIFFILNGLKQANRLLQGATIPYKDFLTFPAAAEQYQLFLRVMRCILQQNAWIKIVDPKNHKNFIEQLKNYAFRPRLREQAHDPTATHKFVHLETKVVNYSSHKSNQKKAKVYTALKKQSCTLIDPTLVTALYGHHNPARTLIGYLFDQSLCLPAKGFFRYDKGTYFRKWVGSETAVLQYQNESKDYSFKNIDEFRNYIKNDPATMNEGLARVTREACLGIVIARDNAEARIEATVRANIYAKEIGKTIPIIVYDIFARNITILADNPVLLMAETTLALTHPGDNTCSNNNAAELIVAKIKNLLIEHIIHVENKLFSSDFISPNLALAAQQKDYITATKKISALHSQEEIYTFINMVYLKNYSACSEIMKRHKTQLDILFACLRILESGCAVLDKLGEPSYGRLVEQFKANTAVLLNFNMQNDAVAASRRLEELQLYFNRPEIQKTLSDSQPWMFWTHKNQMVHGVRGLLAEFGGHAEMERQENRLSF